MRQKPLPGTRYRVKMGGPDLLDDVARKEFERWLAVTGRGRDLDWTSIRVEHGATGTWVEAVTK